MSIEETAEAMGMSPATVKRRWKLARAWLHREIDPDERRTGSRSEPGVDPSGRERGSVFRESLTLQVGAARTRELLNA